MDAAMVNREKLLSRGDVASLLGVSVETLKGWARRGVGPAFSRSGPVRGRVWYQLDDVLAWLDSRKQVASAPRGVGRPPRPVSLPGGNDINHPVSLSADGAGGPDEKSVGVFHAAKEGDA